METLARDVSRTCAHAVCKDSASSSPLVVINDVSTSVWDEGLGELFLRTGARFAREEARHRTRYYVRGQLGPVSRKNSWQLADQGRPCHGRRFVAPAVRKQLGS